MIRFYPDSIWNFLKFHVGRGTAFIEGCFGELCMHCHCFSTSSFYYQRSWCPEDNKVLWVPCKLDLAPYSSLKLSFYCGIRFIYKQHFYFLDKLAALHSNADSVSLYMFQVRKIPKTHMHAKFMLNKTFSDL